MREVVEGIWWWDSVGLFIRSAPFKENTSSYVMGLSPPTAPQKPYIMGLECWCLFVLTIIEVYFLDFIFTERQIIYYFCIRSFPFSHDLVVFNYLFLVRVFKKLFFTKKFMCEIHKYVKSIILKKSQLRQRSVFPNWYFEPAASLWTLDSVDTCTYCVL